MKRIICFAVFASLAFCCHSQFILTPSAGLMTEDGPYIIQREGTESENYYAAKKAVENAIPDAEIGDLEYEKSFNASSTIKDRRKLPGALIATDWTIDYTIEVECTDGKVMISFKNIGALKAKKKGEVIMNVYPSTGENSMLNQIMGVEYIFNSKGVVAKGCKKLKEIFEEYANTIATKIENNLK